MYQLPVNNLEKVRKARKAVKNVLSEIGLEDCQKFLEELDGKKIEEDSEEEDPLLGTEWTDFTDGYNGRLRKKWPYRSRTMCCIMCKYSSKNIYHYRNHVARCHEYLQRLCSLTSCQRCIFVAHPRAVKKHILLFHSGRATDSAVPVAPSSVATTTTTTTTAVAGGAIHRAIERYKCRKCSYPSQSVFAIKKHIILKHMEGVAEQYIGYRHPIAGSNAKLYCCKACTVNTGNLDQMLHHLLVDPKHYSISTQVQAMIYDNKAGPAAVPRAISTANGNGLYVTLPNLAPKPMNSKPFVVPSNGQPGSGTVVALQQLQGASNSATLICAPGSNQAFLPPQASALVQLASAEAKGLLQPGATISLRGSSVVQYPSVKPPTPAVVASPQAQQVLVPAPKPAVAQVPPANQVTLQGTMLTSQSLLSHLIPTGNRVNGMPTYTFAPLQVAVPVTQSSTKPTEQTSNQAKKWITCPLCNELFPSNVFDMHIEVAHQTKLATARTESLASRAAFLKKMPDKTIKCLTCKVLLSERSVLQHLLHGLSCLYCSTLFFSVKQLAEHVKKHNPTGKLYCDFLRQNYKIYTKSNAGLLIPYFDVTTEAPQEILGECEVNLALVTSSLELIYVKLLPSSRSEVCTAPVKVNASCCPFCNEKFQAESKYLQHLKQKHLVAPTIHAILKTDAFKCIYCNGVYTGKVTQQAVMLHIQRCRCSPKPPQVPKITAPPPQLVTKAPQAPRQPSGLYFLQVPQTVTVKPLQPKPPPQNKDQLESTKRLEAALKQVIEINKREREQRASVRRKEPPEPEMEADPKVKLALEPLPQDRRGYEERRDFIARYFNLRPYLNRIETEELCRRLSLSKSELVALFSKKRIRCMKSFSGSTATVLLGFDMARLARLQHPLDIPEQRVVETREIQLDELPELTEDATTQPADAAEAALEPEPMDESGIDKTAAEVPMEQNN
ncbi:ADNP homeobox protein 2 [Hippocampus comes]|uniref:ADNP homeobox 2b n=1 Tax=Hippocampus comes TaxID=109280 RepID=A0A3Q2YDW3_HIPCM|nr:PREDICTED: ADNP homeobox protein 2 [Hippocampus comes]XP_019730517.1 PREDICTED: ADNP homeobox protein 2 [Hippocampus comes]